MLKKLDAQRKERIDNIAGKHVKNNEPIEDLATGAAHRLLKQNQYKPPLPPQPNKLPPISEEGPLGVEIQGKNLQRVNSDGRNLEWHKGFGANAVKIQDQNFNFKGKPTKLTKGELQSIQNSYGNLNSDLGQLGVGNFASGSHMPLRGP